LRPVARTPRGQAPAPGDREGGLRRPRREREPRAGRVDQPALPAEGAKRAADAPRGRDRALGAADAGALAEPFPLYGPADRDPAAGLGRPALPQGPFARP